jgi:hypothetical protein
LKELPVSPKDESRGDDTAAALASRFPASEALIAASRRTLKTAFPGAAETVDAKAGLLSYGYGPGYKNVVATLILSQRAVKIGIPRSAVFSDPHALLRGQGKVHRHIPIATTNDLEQPGVFELLAASLEAWKLRCSE